jgi:hypothetical protein
MNERIKELAIESAKYLDWDFPNDPTEYTFTSDSLSKFAELIVKECVTVLNNRFMGDMNREDLEVRRCVADLKEHFGVEK